MPPYKLIVTYGARSYKNYKVELCTVSSWSWDIHVERQSNYNQLLGHLRFASTADGLQRVDGGVGREVLHDLDLAVDRVLDVLGDIPINSGISV